MYSNFSIFIDRERRRSIESVKFLVRSAPIDINKIGIDHVLIHRTVRSGGDQGNSKIDIRATNLSICCKEDFWLKVIGIRSILVKHFNIGIDLLFYGDKSIQIRTHPRITVNRSFLQVGTTLQDCRTAEIKIRTLCTIEFIADRTRLVLV